MSKKVYKVGKRMVGELVDGHVLYKKVKRSVHLLVVSNSWAWDENVVQRAKLDGADRMHIYDVETNRNYYVSIERFYMHAYYVDFGFGKQLALPLQYWSETPVEQLSLL